MTTVSNKYQVLINVSPEAAFDTVSDMARHAEWNDDLVIEALTEGPPRLGSQYRSWGWNSKKSGPPNDIEVTGFERPTRFAFMAKDPAFGKVSHEFTFKAEGGGTLIERTTTANWGTLFVLFWRVAGEPLIARPRMSQSLGALKKQLEARQG